MLGVPKNPLIRSPLILASNGTSIRVFVSTGRWSTFCVKNDKDGTFWMDAVDFIQLSSRVRFGRTFGPTWQCAAQYGTFGKDRVCLNGTHFFGGVQTMQMYGDFEEFPL